MENKIIHIIHNVCRDCGLVANYLTCWKKYGNPPKESSFDVSTYHNANCDFCGRYRSVTEVRDFFYPDFGLLKKIIKRLHPRGDRDFLYNCTKCGKLGQKHPHICKK